MTWFLLCYLFSDVSTAQDLPETENLKIYIFFLSAQWFIHFPTYYNKTRVSFFLQETFKLFIIKALALGFILNAWNILTPMVEDVSQRESSVSETLAWTEREFHWPIRDTVGRDCLKGNAPSGASPSNHEIVSDRKFWRIHTRETTERF